ncbi:MAG: cytochrome c3 family protein [Anaerolineales bacterium]|nr:cytochrome c3 family protein [Anaerolineales bacterium]
MRKMRNFSYYPWIAFILALFCAAFWAGTSSANGGPHGNFTSDTDGCAGCHRAHSAKSNDLLVVSDSTALCLTCHAGTGASTDVMGGTYLGGAEGALDGGLRAGGFSTATMDTALDGTAAPVSVTSSHHVGSGGVMWGNGAIGSGVGKSYTLSCSSCHNPHGESSYRMLRPIPSGSDAASSVYVLDQTTKNYTVTSPTNRYLGEGYGVQSTSLSAWCSQCHSRYMTGSGSGHTDSGDSAFAFRHRTDVVPCVACHVSHGSTATMAASSGAALWPNDASAPSGDSRSSLLRANNRAVCVSCHVTDGRVGGGACDSCHGAPPTGGAHLKHSSASAVGYGMVGAFSDSTNYIFGCGECHPTDSAFHRDGTVEVDLNPTTAPPGSLKARNSVAASYDTGTDTCGGAYCHSGETVSSGAISNPDYTIDGTGRRVYTLDSHGNMTYTPPYTDSIVFGRDYKPTPKWNTQSISGLCTDCHAFPLTTSVPSVQAGVGDSHQWVDDYGYGNLHAYNMSYEPIPCSTCHDGEVSPPPATGIWWSRSGMDVTTYSPLPIVDRTNHVNGMPNVKFTATPLVYNTFSYGAVSFDLSLASYDPNQRACGNVGCHLAQNYAVWGAPYRWWTDECDLCHRYALPTPPPLGPLTFGAAPTAENMHPVPMNGKSCTACHTDAHGR